MPRFGRFPGSLFFLVSIHGWLLLTGCASNEKQTPKEATSTPEKSASEESISFQRVGIVRLVNISSNFVLIEGHFYDLPPNLPLKTFEPSFIPGPEGATADLKVGLERAGRFVVADIVSGLPGKGDVVYR